MLAFVCLFLSAPTQAPAGGVGSRVFVVERASERLAVYDPYARRLYDKRISGLGDLRHATMTFSPDLRYGYVVGRSGKLSRVDLEKLELAGTVYTSQSSIDNAISEDGRYLAVAEYIPGGLSIVDANTLKVVAHHDAFFTRAGKKLTSRVTGVVDAPNNRFVCVLIEGAEIWIVDASKPGFPIEHRIKTPQEMPYDAMITPDGRYYLVAHIGSTFVSVLDLWHPDAGVRQISLVDPKASFPRNAPMKLPHMASWTVAGEHAFVPLVGEKRLAVLNRHTFALAASVPLAGDPVYAVRNPTGTQVWVSFSGEGDDALVQVIDTATLKVVRTLQLGRRIYHMTFTPRGGHALVSANGDNKLIMVNAHTYAVEDEVSLRSPSGIFGAWRAFQIGL